MNLFLALFWLICAVLLLIYEQTVGPAQFRIHLGKHDFSWAWFMLLPILYNLKRWWWIRSYRAKQRAQATARVREKWQRRRPATDAPITPDPTFNFTDEPPTSSNPAITDQPPSKNGNAPQ